MHRPLFPCLLLIPLAACAAAPAAVQTSGGTSSPVASLPSNPVTPAPTPHYATPEPRPFRTWIITVRNDSDHSVMLVAGRDVPGGPGKAELVGETLTGSVEPEQTEDVVLTVPTTPQRRLQWAIFVQPAPEGQGPLLVQDDVPWTTEGWLDLQVYVDTEGQAWIGPYAAIIGGRDVDLTGINFR